MEDAVLRTIKRITNKKVERRIQPSHVLKRELFEELTKTLNSLYAKGKIKVGDTANDKYITINANKSD